MTPEFTSLVSDPNTFGMAGLAGQIVWPLFKTRRAILTAQMINAAFFATQYGLMGQTTAMSVCLIGASQSLTALIAGDRRWLARLPAAFLPVVWVMGVLTWSGLPTLLAVMACTLIMLGRMQQDVVRMRAVMLAAAPFGITHDITVGAIPALIGALLSASLSARALRHELITRGVGMRVPRIATA